MQFTLLTELFSTYVGTFESFLEELTKKNRKKLFKPYKKLLSQLLCARCDLIWNLFLQLPHGILKLTNVLMFNSTCELYG